MTVPGTPAVDRSAPPPAGEQRPFRFPDFERHRLANGLAVYVAPSPQAPLVELSLVTAGGAHHDPPGRAGLATLTAALLDEGTERRSALEIAYRLEQLGGSLVTSADWDAGYVAAGLLAADLATGLDLVAEVATSPAFPPEEIERLRGLRLADLSRRSAQPDDQATDALARTLYRGTVYAHPAMGTEEAVEALTRDDVEGLYRRLVTPHGSALIAAGDFEPAALLDLAGSLLGDWQGAPRPAAPTIEPAAGDGVEVVIVDRPGAAQTELRLGHVGLPYRHPDRVPLQVASALLGGKFTSRLNLNHRERHGFTYGVRSSISSRVGPGPFTVATAVDTAVAGRAVAETLGELRRLRDEPVGADEVEETRSYLLGTIPYTLQRLDGVVRRLEMLAIHDLPDDYYDGFVERLRAVETADVERVARRHLHPERLKIVAVGPADALRPQLADFGPVGTA